MIHYKSILITIFLPICLIAIGTQLLTTTAYLMISEPFYSANENFENYYQASLDDYGVYITEDGRYYVCKVEIDGERHRDPSACEAYENVDYGYVADRIMKYLNYRYNTLQVSGNEDSDLGMFNEEELSHMVDVKNVFTIVRIVFLIGLVLVGLNSWYLLKKDRNLFHKTIHNIWVWPLFFSLFMGTMFVIDFEKTFEYFHYIAFDNDEWILFGCNALIIILPLEFWTVSGSLILLFLIVSIIIIRVINRNYWKKVRI